MANQIAAHVPKASAPEIEVAQHIVQFWTTEMRERLHSDVDRSKLDPIVLKAMELESVK